MIMKTVQLRRCTDNRGSLVENTLERVMLDSRHFFISKSKVGVIRGNHYHERKSEWFYVAQGECTVCVEDITTKKREEISVKDSDDVLINIAPNQAHAFKNTGAKELILLALVNEVLDQSDPDTYEYKVY